MQKLVVVAQFYSGLDSIIDSKHWEHSGSPAYYHFVSQLDSSSNFDYQLFLLSTKLSKNIVSKKIFFDNLKNPAMIIPYYPFVFSGPVNFLKIIEFLYNKIRQYYFVLRNSHSAKCYYVDRDNLLLSALLLLFTRKKVITRLLGVTDILYGHLVKKKNLYSKLIRWVFDHPRSHFVCTKDGSYAELAEEKVGKERFCLLFNGVNKVKGRSYSHKENNEKVNIIYLSRIEPNKGHIDFLNAIAKSNLSHRLEVVFVGDGSLRGDCIKLANSIGVGEIVHFVGRLSHEKAMIYLKKADLFLSLNNHGSLGNGVLEAAQFGLPIVTLLHPGCLTDDLNLFHVIKQNQDLQNNVADFLNRFIDDPSLRQSMSMNSIEFSERCLVSWEERMDIEFRFIKNICG